MLKLKSKLQLQFDKFLILVGLLFGSILAPGAVSIAKTMQVYRCVMLDQVVGYFDQPCNTRLQVNALINNRSRKYDRELLLESVLFFEIGQNSKGLVGDLRQEFDSALVDYKGSYDSAGNFKQAQNNSKDLNAKYDINNELIKIKQLKSKRCVNAKARLAERTKLLEDLKNKVALDGNANVEIQNEHIEDFLSKLKRSCKRYTKLIGKYCDG